MEIERGQPCQCLCLLGYTGGGLRQMNANRVWNISYIPPSHAMDLFKSGCVVCLELKLPGGQTFDLVHRYSRQYVC
jgi:hypothetical protein